MDDAVGEVRVAAERQRQREGVVAEARRSVVCAAEYVSYWPLLDAEDRAMVTLQIRRAAKQLWALAEDLARERDEGR